MMTSAVDDAFIHTNTPLTGNNGLLHKKWDTDKKTKGSNKSLDNHNMHPKMLHNLGPNALEVLRKLFNNNKYLNVNNERWKRVWIFYSCFEKDKMFPTYIVNISSFPIELSEKWVIACLISGEAVDKKVVLVWLLHGALKEGAGDLDRNYGAIRYVVLD